MLRSAGHTLDYAGIASMEEIQTYGDMEFCDQWTFNTKKFFMNRYKGLCKDLMNLMYKKVSVVGYIHSKTEGEPAMMAYAIGACDKAKREGTYKTEAYRPYALFIVRDEHYLRFFNAARELVPRLDVTIVRGNGLEFENELKSKIIFQRCDIAILTSDAFHKYVQNRLIYFTNLKFLAVEHLDWHNDNSRMEHFENLFKDPEFPKAGDRIVIFFDEYYLKVAEELLVDDTKAFIVFGRGEVRLNYASTPPSPISTPPPPISAPPTNSNDAPTSHVPVHSPRRGFITKSTEIGVKTFNDPNDNLRSAVAYVNPERAARRGDPKHIFKVVPVEKRTEAVIQHLQTLLEECAGDKLKFPRTVIYVQSEEKGCSLRGRISRTLQVDSGFSDCYKLTAKVKSTLETFHSGRPRILMVTRKGHDVVFQNVDHYIFMDCTPSIEALAQMDNKVDKPLTIMSFCSHQDVKKLEKIRKVLEKHNLSVNDLDSTIEDLMPLYKEDPAAGDYDSYDELFN